MSDQSLLLLKVFQRVLTDVQLLFRSKGLRVWGVVPCVNVIPSKLNYLEREQEPDDMLTRNFTQDQLADNLLKQLTSMFFTFVFS